MNDVDDPPSADIDDHDILPNYSPAIERQQERQAPFEISWEIFYLLL